MLNRPDFERLWTDSTIRQKEAACRMILLGNVTGLHNWIQAHPSIELGEMNIRQLRTRGRKAGVLNYSRLNKAELIVAINFKEPKHDKTGNDLQNRNNGRRNETNDTTYKSKQGSVTDSQGCGNVLNDIHTGGIQMDSIYL